MTSDAEDLRAQLAEQEGQLERAAFAVRVLTERSEKAMELCEIKRDQAKAAEAEVRRRRPPFDELALGEDREELLA